MMKRLWALLLVLSMLLTALPVASAEEAEAEAPTSVDCCYCTTRVKDTKGLHRPDFTGKLIEVTPQRVEDTFRYLDEFYVEKHPEAALEIYHGTQKDQEVLLTLAQIITKDCKTPKEMADAISDWVYNNIVYDVQTSAYPSDTFYRREGNCLSYALLIQNLLRMLGIPAVVGDGWRGNMETNTVDLFNMDGHAWCFVLLDGQWVLYDPLWLAEGTTDRDYMARWIYFDTVEFVTPAYDEDNLPPEAYDKAKIYYVNGRVVSYANDFPEGFGTTTNFINNMVVGFVSCQDEHDTGISDGWNYLDPDKDQSKMVRGEIYGGGWISYGDYYTGRQVVMAHTYANGMILDGEVKELDGVEYWIGGVYSYIVTAAKEDYFISDGCVTLPVGYSGPFLWLSWGEQAYEGCTLTFTAISPEIATIDAQGNITAHSEGYASFRVELVREEDNALMSMEYMRCIISNEKRIPDYTDHGEQKPEEPEAPAFGDVVANSWYEDSVNFMVQKGLMNGVGNGRFNPSGNVTRAMLVTILYRAEGEPSVAGMKNPFVDVPKTWYTNAVIWAADQGIVNGVSHDRFNPDGNITREQIATILYRYDYDATGTDTLPPFADSDQISTYALRPMNWAISVGLINGVGGGRLAPKNTATRAQIATILARYLQNP